MPCSWYGITSLAFSFWRVKFSMNRVHAEFCMPSKDRKNFMDVLMGHHCGWYFPRVSAFVGERERETAGQREQNIIQMKT